MDDNKQLSAPTKCLIEVGGKSIGDLYSDLKLVTVELSRNRASIAKLEFSTVRQPDGTWNVVDNDLFLPWKEISIQLQLVDEVKPLLKGYISDLMVNFSMDDPRLVVNCQDQSLIMDREHICAVWGDEDNPINDLDIVKSIAAKYNLEVTGEAGSAHEFIAQDATDIRFLKQRSESNGFELVINNGQLYFGPARTEYFEQNNIIFAGGDSSNCVQLTLCNDGYKPEQIKVMSFDQRSSKESIFMPDVTRLGKVNCETVGSGLADFSWKLPSNGQSINQLEQTAQFKANQNSWKISVNGSLDGTAYGAPLQIGRTVEVEGIGKVYSGIFYVDEVTHIMSNSGYIQKFRLLKNALADR